MNCEQRGSMLIYPVALVLYLHIPSVIADTGGTWRTPRGMLRGGAYPLAQSVGNVQHKRKTARESIATF